MISVRHSGRSQGTSRFETMDKAKKGQDSNKASLFQPDRQFQMTDLIDYKRLTPGSEAFIELKVFGYAEILVVDGIGLSSVPATKLEAVSDSLTSFLRRYLNDVTFVIAPFPVSTAKQQAFWGERYMKYTRMVQEKQYKNRQAHQVLIQRQRFCQDKIKAAKGIEETLENREFFAVVFGDTVRELRSNLNSIDGLLGDAQVSAYLKFRMLERSQKERVMERINNPNVRV